MTTLTVFFINVHAHLIFFLSILISNKLAQIWTGPVSKISKKFTYCIFIAVHILLRWFWLELFRTTHTITCWKERLNFENTLYTYTHTPSSFRYKLLFIRNKIIIRLSNAQLDIKPFLRYLENSDWFLGLKVFVAFLAAYPAQMAKL
jgi:hypothetical protein